MPLIVARPEAAMGTSCLQCPSSWQLPPLQVASFSPLSLTTLLYLAIALSAGTGIRTHSFEGCRRAPAFHYLTPLALGSST